MMSETVFARWKALPLKQDDVLGGSQRGGQEGWELKRGKGRKAESAE